MFGEEISRGYFEYIFEGKKFIKSRPKWLKSPKNHSIELDGYCSELKLAFEYNGVQHYKFVPRFHKTMEQKMKKPLLKKSMIKNLL